MRVAADNTASAGFFLLAAFVQCWIKASIVCPLIGAISCAAQPGSDRDVAHSLHKSVNVRIVGQPNPRGLTVDWSQPCCTPMMGETFCNRFGLGAPQSRHMLWLSYRPNLSRHGKPEVAVGTAGVITLSLAMCVELDT
jgi:hypothetical protein